MSYLDRQPDTTLAHKAAIICFGIAIGGLAGCMVLAIIVGIEQGNPMAGVPVAGLLSIVAILVGMVGIAISSLDRRPEATAETEAQDPS